MAINHRLTDCNKWTNGNWFRKLDPKYKLFWLYIHDKCDQAGVWIQDMEELNFYIGLEYDPDSLLKVFEDKIKYFPDTNKWWLKDYCILQHTSFLKEDESGAPRKCAVRLLKEHGLYDAYKEHFKSIFPTAKVG